MECIVQHHFRIHNPIDASEWGMGGWYWDKRGYFSTTWCPEHQKEALGPNELRAILQALQLWGLSWGATTIIIHLDSQFNLHALINRKARKDQVTNQLLRQTFFEQLRFRCRIKLIHIPLTRMRQQYGPANWGFNRCDLE